jgi:hypothetical protein
MAADRPYGEFYDFYSVSPEYFGKIVVFIETICMFLLRIRDSVVCRSVGTDKVVVMLPIAGAPL